MPLSSLRYAELTLQYGKYVLTLAFLLRCGHELQALEAVKHLSTSSGTAIGKQESGWETVVEKKDIRVWKRPIPNSHLYEYRGQLSSNLTHVNGLGSK